MVFGVFLDFFRSSANTTQRAVLSSGGFFFFGVDGETQYDATGGGGVECTRYLFIYTTRRHVCVDGWVVSNHSCRVYGYMVGYTATGTFIQYEYFILL